jgi:hypothetical protein
MKFKIFIFLFILSPITHGQFQIESNFNVVATARNQSVVLHYKFNKLQIGMGVKYSFNKGVNFPQNVFYKRTFYAINPREHWGGELAVKYPLFNLKDVVQISAFYNAQFTRSHIKFETYYAVGQLVENPTSEFDYIYVKHQDYIGPVLALENNIGLAFDINLHDRIYFSQKFGLGIMFYDNRDKNTTVLGAGNWVFSEMLSFGVGYKFKK